MESVSRCSAPCCSKSQSSPSFCSVGSRLAEGVPKGPVSSGSEAEVWVAAGLGEEGGDPACCGAPEPREQTEGDEAGVNQLCRKSPKSHRSRRPNWAGDVWGVECKTWKQH